MKAFLKNIQTYWQIYTAISGFITMGIVMTNTIQAGKEEQKSDFKKIVSEIIASEIKPIKDSIAKTHTKIDKLSLQNAIQTKQIGILFNSFNSYKLDKAQSEKEQVKILKDINALMPNFVEALKKNESSNRILSDMLNQN